jgi:hypothetical protein
LKKKNGKQKWDKSPCDFKKYKKQR